MYRDAFFRFYANLPIGIRRDVILDLKEHGPITWEVAHREVRIDSELGKEILEKLIELGFVPITKQGK